MAAGRGAARRPSGRWAAWLILLLLLAGAGVWILRQRRPSGSAATALHMAAPTSAACGAPLPDLRGQAVARAKGATFTTVEQLLRLSAPAPTLYRVQAQLLQYSAVGQEYRLLLGSAVNPGLTLPAHLPAGSCVANRDDGALYDELRQDINLQFGPITSRITEPPQATQVIVTGFATFGSNGIELRPVLDFQVQ
ncbi:MAG TPA: hypothetical protein VNF74_08000 [Terriglobales bacterium]|nr:hypothetical protein [Terriglobales bacterium]